MATVKLWTDAEAEAHPMVKAVFDDIRASRKTELVNILWCGLANHAEILALPFQSRTTAPIASIRIQPRPERRG